MSSHKTRSASGGYNAFGYTRTILGGMAVHEQPSHRRFLPHRLLTPKKTPLQRVLFPKILNFPREGRMLLTKAC